MAYGTGRHVEWYSVLYFTGHGEPTFRSPDATPYLEGGKEVRFDTLGEAVWAIERTPMYRRDPRKASRKFRVVRTTGDIVHQAPIRALKKFLKSDETYVQWFEIVHLEDERSFDAPWGGVEVSPGQPARFGSFKDAFNGLMEMMRIWNVSDDDKPHLNIVWFQSEIMSEEWAKPQV